MSKFLKPFFILLSLLIVFPFFANADNSEYADYIPLSVPFILEDKTFSNFVCSTVSISTYYTDCFYISDDTDFFLYYDTGDNISLKLLANSSYINCNADNGVNNPATCSYVYNYYYDIDIIVRYPIYESFFHTMPIYDPTGTTIISEPNYFISPTLPEISQDSNISIEFKYPKMLAPVYHAYIKLPEITDTEANVRIKVNYENIAEELKEHWNISIFKMVDSSYDIIDTTQPYFESFNLTELDEFGYLNFTVPIMQDEDYYFSTVISPDSTYASIYPEYPHFFKYNFSLSGVSPSNPNFNYGQSFNSPNIDDEGNPLISTGSALGDYIANLIVPNSDYLGNQITIIKNNFQNKFSSFFALKDIFSTSISGLSSSQTVPTFSSFSMYGASVNIINFDLIDPYMPTIRNYITAFLYLVLFIFLIKKISLIFSS